MSRNSQLNPLLQSGRVTGRVIGHRDGFGFLAPDTGDQDIYLSNREMLKAMHGDRVVVTITGLSERGKLEGRIEEVLERNHRQLVGQYFEENGIAFVRPENRHIALDLRIPEGSSLNATHGQMVVAEITEPPSRYAPPVAKIIEVLGDHLSAGMEIEVAIRNFEIPNTWPEEVIEQADEFGAEVKESDKQGRYDLRELPFVTIDGEDARDFDDAVYCEAEGSGWRLLVAIADVSHYVRPGSPLDQEAEIRGTSVYFPDYVIPMLPEVLSNGLCSLKPKVDRLAMVCDMHIDDRGHVQHFRFCEAVIRSAERLTYTRVQKVIDGDAEEHKALAPLVPYLNQLHKLYKTLHRARLKRGAMDFDSTETRIIFDSNRKIERIVPLVRKDAHRLIEECMLCANICAAQLFETHEIPALYRVHDSPKVERLAALREYLANLGLWLGGGDKPTPEDFSKLVETLHERTDRSVIETMVLRTQAQAVYQPENLGHFGLAYPAYTHFTSPIRRYPDLLVHRGIRSLIRSDRPSKFVKRIEGVKPIPVRDIYPYDLAAMQNLGASCSMTERRAEEATRDVDQWLKCEYLSNHIGSSFPGVVAAVTGFGLFVQLQDLFIEGLVHITSLPADYYQFDTSIHALVGDRTRRIYRMGDSLQVIVAAVSLEERKIDFTLDAESMGITQKEMEERPGRSGSKKAKESRKDGRTENRSRKSSSKKSTSSSKSSRKSRR